MTEEVIHYQSEAQLMGFGESDSSGAWIKFQVMPEDLDKFRGLKGITFDVTLTNPSEPTNVAPQKTTPKQKAENSLAGKMHRQGYFLNPKLWDVMEQAGIYTQDMHKKYIESLSCLVKDNTCDGDIVGHHVRDAANSGTGIKPPHWYLVPLCSTTHHENWAHKTITRQERHKLLEAAVQLTASQMKYHMKKILGRDSLSGISKMELKAFEESIGFEGMVGI